MALQSSQPGVISLSQAIDHYFELALYLLVLTGFATLAGTGGLDLPSTILVGGALAVRGFLLAKRRQFVISERWTTPLAVAYFFFFAAPRARPCHPRDPRLPDGSGGGCAHR